MYPERRLSMDKIISSLPTKPVSILPPSTPSDLTQPLTIDSPSPQITNYSTTPTSTDSSHLGWLRPGDPRSELVLSLFKEGHGLPLLLNGIRPTTGKPWSATPPSDLIAAISPLSHLRHGDYTTPTFLIHGTDDEIVPFGTAVAFCEAMQEIGVKVGLGVVDGARHIHDLGIGEEEEGWWEGVGIGYEFLFKELGL